MDPPFHLLNLITVIFFLLLSSQLCDALTFPARTTRPNTSTSRRQWLSGSAVKVISAAGIVATSSPTAAIAADEEYNNPNIPAGPEERSGLIVLRVAEVAQFQEKILRAILNGDLKDVVVTPQQIVFGTQILLRNSDIAGNMQLMIDNEMKKKDQKQARIVAANVMNALQKVSSTAAQIERELSPADYDELANLYRLVRVELNTLYELLPTMEKQKYDNYFVQVTEYEKKIAEGVYNPDIDGVLKFDYDK